MNRPCAAPGLDSYRYRSNMGWVMIGAQSDAEALQEAARSLSSGAPERERLQKWDGREYVPVATGSAGDVLGLQDDGTVGWVAVHKSAAVGCSDAVQP